MNNQELKHYGIPGMRWGFRRAKKDEPSNGPSKGKSANKDDVEAPKKVDTRSKDAIRYDDIKHKKLNELSNEELRWLSERIRLEQEYNSRISGQKREKINQIKNDLIIAGTVAENVGKIMNFVDRMESGNGYTSKKYKSFKDTYSNRRKSNGGINKTTYTTHKNKDAVVLTMKKKKK